MMINYRHQVTRVIILFTTIQAFNSQTITSTLNDGEFPCPGQVVNFTCVTRGSLSIIWRSDEYIEQGGNPLEFATFDSPGAMERSPIYHDTIATLISKDIESGEQVLVSQLRIIVSVQFPNPSVICEHDDGRQASATFQMLGDPGVPQHMVPPQQRQVKASGSCVILFSLKPDIDENVKGFMIHVNETSFYEENAANKSTIITGYHVCNCATYTISISAVNTCNRMGQNNTIMLDQGPHLNGLAKCSTADEVTEHSENFNTDGCQNVTDPGVTDSSKGTLSQSSFESCDPVIVAITVPVMVVTIIVTILLAVIITYYVTKYLITKVTLNDTDENAQGGDSAIKLKPK